MVVQLMHFSKEGLLPTAQGMAKKWAPIFQAHRGFKGVTFIRDEEIGEYGALVFWNSEEAATAAAKALFHKEKTGL